MPNGFSYLIDALNSTDILAMDQDSAAQAFRMGTQEEPDRLQEVIAAYYLRLGRMHPAWNAEKKARRVLEQVAVLAVLSDHNLDEPPPTVWRSNLPREMALEGFYDNPSRYGASMKCLAKYAQAEGLELSMLLLGREPIFVPPAQHSRGALVSLPRDYYLPAHLKIR